MNGGPSIIMLETMFHVTMDWGKKGAYKQIVHDIQIKIDQKTSKDITFNDKITMFELHSMLVAPTDISGAQLLSHVISDVSTDCPNCSILHAGECCSPMALLWHNV